MKKRKEKKRIYPGASSIGLLYLYFENQISILMEDFVTYPLFFFQLFLLYEEILERLIILFRDLELFGSLYFSSLNL